MADAQMAKFGDFYYLVGTPCPGDLNMQWVGIWKSRDLINWSGPYLAFEGDERDKPMWASEIAHKGDEYYIITTCNMWHAGSTMMLQKAPTPLGPYTFHAHLKKKGLDPSLFVDTDGRSYLLDSEWIAPLNNDWNLLEGDFLGHRDNKEGPFMVKNANRYLRFYARIDDDYSMELETFDGDNPYTDDYKSQGIVFSGVCYPGHGCITTSPDGTQLWYASHYMTQGWESRKLTIDPIQFGNDGMPVPAKRNVNPQAVPSFSKQHANIATGKPVNSSEGNPLLACDNDISTSWTCAAPKENSFIEVDLMGEFQIDQTRMSFANATTASFQLLGSCDRINWKSLGEISLSNKRNATANADNGFYRYLRLTNFKTANPVSLTEWQVVSSAHHMPQPTGKKITLWQGDSILHMQRGGYVDLPAFSLPKTGTYDVVFEVASTTSRHNQFSIHDGDRRLVSESVAHTGVADNWAQIIAFDTVLPAGSYDRLRFVADEGDFLVKRIELVEME